jgi:hypothetical protein
MVDGFQNQHGRIQYRAARTRNIFLTPFRRKDRMTTITKRIYTLAVGCTLAAMGLLSCNTLPFENTTVLGEDLLGDVDTALVRATTVHVDSVYTFTWDTDALSDSLRLFYEMHRDSIDSIFALQYGDSIFYEVDSVAIVARYLQNRIERAVRDIDPGLHNAAYGNISHIYAGSWHNEYATGYLEFPAHTLVTRQDNNDEDTRPHIALDSAMHIHKLELLMPFDDSFVKSHAQAQLVVDRLDIHAFTKSHGALLDTTSPQWDSTDAWHAEGIEDSIYNETDTVLYARFSTDSSAATALRDSLLKYRGYTDRILSLPLGIALRSDSAAIRYPISGSRFHHKFHCIVHSSHAADTVQDTLSLSYADYSVHRSPSATDSTESSWQSGVQTAIALDFSSFFDSVLSDSLYPFASQLKIDIASLSLHEPLLDSTRDSLSFRYTLTDNFSTTRPLAQSDYERGVLVQENDTLFLPLDPYLWHFKRRDSARLVLLLKAAPDDTHRIWGLIQWLVQQDQALTLETALSSRR